ncbi:MAG: phosphatidate cytidylyltransferase [Armatimonadetes bacterium]|nr:phosphatidate cytidylyltransferase [Armatimonadota bacterium]
MLARVLTAAVGIPLLTYAALADSLWPVRVLALALGAAGVYEFLRAEKALAKWWAWLPLAAFAPLVLAVTPPPLFILIFFLSWMGHRLIPDLRDSDFRNVALFLAPAFWILVPIWLLAALRAYDMPSGEHLSRLSTGSALLLILLCLWASDIAAMLVGRSLGKHRMDPEISPNKTWEGAAANLVAALLVGVFVAPAFGMTWWAGLSIGAIVGIFGQSGDYAESYWKRSVGIKDSGSILPGHGGILDRFDSLLFSVPPAALLLNYV